ncbi:MAG: YlqD family protein [Cyanobacteria bacterium P01_H01_bin.15]
MTDLSSGLTLKRPITLKVIVTDRWREAAEKQLQAQISQVDNQVQQIDTRAQRAIAELQKQAIHPPGPQTQQQIASVQAQAQQQKTQLVQRKNQALQQMQQIQLLENGQEVAQPQALESFCEVKVGDNLGLKLAVEIVVKDDVIQEIRGEI